MERVRLAPVLFGIRCAGYERRPTSGFAINLQMKQCDAFTKVRLNLNRAQFGDGQRPGSFARHKTCEQ